MSTQEKPPTTSPRTATGRPPVGPFALWYGVLGGVVAWATHLLLAWSDMEISCIAPSSGSSVNQHGGSPGTASWWVVSLAVVVPWLVTLGALLTCLVLRRRTRRAGDDIDPVALGRTTFMLFLGIFLDLMSLAAITGGGIALLTLDPCS
jgi:hypothetical protein